MKTLFICLITLFISGYTQAQEKFVARNGTISFSAEGVVKDGVKAVTDQAACVLDASNGEVVFQVLIKSFKFEKALMQEHFNENYMESHKFPKAILKGKVNDWSKVDLTKDGQYPVSVSGALTIHGVTKNITEKGTIEVKGGKINMKSGFQVILADYGISIPKIVEDKLAKVADVSLQMQLSKP